MDSCLKLAEMAPAQCDGAAHRQNRRNRHSLMRFCRRMFWSLPGFTRSIDSCHSCWLVQGSERCHGSGPSPTGFSRPSARPQRMPVNGHKKTYCGWLLPRRKTPGHVSHAIVQTGSILHALTGTVGRLDWGENHFERPACGAAWGQPSRHVRESPSTGLPRPIRRINRLPATARDGCPPVRSIKVPSAARPLYHGNRHSTRRESAEFRRYRPMLAARFSCRAGELSVVSRP